MKKVVVCLGLVVSLAGFPGFGDISLSKISAAKDLVKAVTLSDKDVANYASEYASYADSTNKVAKGGSNYSARLEKLTKGLKGEDGLKLNFKVYMSSEVNAFSLADGTIRVYSGLMDRMNDDELMFVIGHEIGHIKEGHSKARFRTAFLASAARKGAAGASGVGGALARSELGGLGEALVKAQFSQSNEKDADDYGFAFLKKHKVGQNAGPSALMKLAELGGESSLLSTHPDSKKRAKRLSSQL